MGDGGAGDAGGTDAPLDAQCCRVAARRLLCDLAAAGPEVAGRVLARLPMGLGRGNGELGTGQGGGEGEEGGDREEERTGEEEHGAEELEDVRLDDGLPGLVRAMRTAKLTPALVFVLARNRVEVLAVQGSAEKWRALDTSGSTGGTSRRWRPRRGEPRRRLRTSHADLARVSDDTHGGFPFLLRGHLFFGWAGRILL